MKLKLQGIYRGWNTRESGWDKQGMNENLRTIGDHLGITVNHTGTRPAVGAEGAAWINLGTGDYAVYSRGPELQPLSWIEYPPRAGVVAYNPNTDLVYVNTGTSWREISEDEALDLLTAGDFPSTSTTGIATADYVGAAIAAIPVVADATDTVKGKSSLAVEANFPSTSDAESTTPAYVKKAIDTAVAAIPVIADATDTVKGKVSLAVAANVPSTSDTEATTPAYVNAAVSAAIDAIPDAAIDAKGLVNLVSMQVLGDGDKVINGVRIGRGAIADPTDITNTVLGNGALASNTAGAQNTAVGSNTLASNTVGANNTAFGTAVLFANTDGNSNTAFGANAMSFNQSGSANTAVGVGAFGFPGGDTNTVVGSNAMPGNPDGDPVSGNTAVGSGCMNRANFTGNNNSVFGKEAGKDVSLGSNNTILGTQYTTAGTYSSVFNVTNQNNRLVMAHTGVTNAYVQVAWTVVSDERDKEILGEAPLGLEFINKLSAIRYRYKQTREDLVGDGPIRYGYSAQATLAAEMELAGEAVVVDNEDPDKLRFNDQALLTALTNAVKELSAANAELADRITALENK